jgi:hypothetical protein
MIGDGHPACGAGQRADDQYTTRAVDGMMDSRPVETGG